MGSPRKGLNFLWSKKYNIWTTDTIYQPQHYLKKVNYDPKWTEAVRSMGNHPNDTKPSQQGSFWSYLSTVQLLLNSKKMTCPSTQPGHLGP